MSHQVQCCELKHCAEEVGEKGRGLLISEAAGVKIPSTHVISANQFVAVLRALSQSNGVEWLTDKDKYDKRTAGVLRRSLRQMQIDIVYDTPITYGSNGLIARDS